MEDWDVHSYIRVLNFYVVSCKAFYDNFLIGCLSESFWLIVTDAQLLVQVLRVIPHLQYFLFISYGHQEIHKRNYKEKERYSLIHLYDIESILNLKKKKKYFKFAKRVDLPTLSLEFNPLRPTTGLISPDDTSP